jgi:hypothetical protein
LEVARATSWRWQEKRLGGLEVARVTFGRWQDKHLVGGKRYVLDVARETLRGIISDVVAMGETLQDVAIATVL